MAGLPFKLPSRLPTGGAIFQETVTDNVGVADSIVEKLTGSSSVSITFSDSTNITDNVLIAFSTVITDPVQITDTISDPTIGYEYWGLIPVS